MKARMPKMPVKYFLAPDLSRQTKKKSILKYGKRTGKR